MVDYRRLLDMAIENLDNAYALYSNCKVSAALLCDDDSVVLGVNVENASFGGTICAERSAFVSAISAGKRGFKAIAVATSLEDAIMPCGICRQFMLEFNKDLDVIIGDQSEFKVYRLKDLLPSSFGKEDLKTDL